jgi:HEAT repeat protein
VAVFLPILLLLLIAIIGVEARYLRQQATRRREDRWARVAEEFGFERSTDSPSFELKRERRSSTIWIYRQEVADKQRKTRMIVCIDGPAPVTNFIGLRGEDGAPLRRNGSKHLGPAAKGNAEGGLLVGDPAFDSIYCVAGPPALLLALLDGPCRAQLVTVRLRGGATLQQGQLSYRVPCGDQADAVWHGIEQATLLARALRIKESEIPDRLARNARGKDLPQVRVRNLEALAKLPECKDRASALALKLLRDPSPEMRLEVALRLGAKELEPLLALAARERDKDVRVALLAHLTKFAGQRLWPTLEQALRSRHEAVQRAAAEAACATGYTELAPRIARKIARQLTTASNETLVALTGALRLLREPTTEGVLVQLLEHDSRDVQRAAAVALGEFGSVAAVEPLLECSARIHLGGDTKQAALRAVARIQSRLDHVELGALALAEPAEQAGALSLADENAYDGAVSLVDSAHEKKATQ